MEGDEKEGRGYASGRRVREEADIEGGELPVRKKARHNNTLTSTLMECKCGS
jgi:hypothetical protein